MFCDMAGYTQLAEKLGPEESFQILDQVYEILIQAVYDYGGTVNEIIGDGILALFGAPLALEDAPQRAIRAALDIQRAIFKFSNHIIIETPHVPAIEMRIGIHTGHVVVGSLGNNLRVKFAAVGDAVNLAGRIQGLAEPASVFVSGETFGFTQGFFRFERIGVRTVKGRKAPVEVFRVIAPGTWRTRFDVSAELGLVPFVGRHHDMDSIAAVFQHVKEGCGQSLSIVSEAGMGKSRLLYEFRKTMINQEVFFLEGKCLSYSRGVSYQPFIDIMKTLFHIHDEDGYSDTRKKLRSGIETFGAELSTTLPPLLELLSIKDSGPENALKSPESQKEHILHVLREIIFKYANNRPLILAVEDLHWIDKNSEDALAHLMNSISESKVLLVLTYRPEYTGSWMKKSIHHKVTLDRLTRSESLCIVYHLTGSEVLDVELETMIFKKTEGNPLFIEEYVKSLKSLGIIVKRRDRYCLAKGVVEICIPSTIQEIIMARVDKLPEESKEVLLAGAAIEREFSYGLIREVMNLTDEELLARLSALKEAELVYESGFFPDLTYVFKHAVTQEVIYDSILPSRKRRLHESIGNAIESLYRENLEPYYEILCRHFQESGNWEKGANYCYLASRKSEGRASFPDAIEFSEKRITCLEQLACSKDVRKRLIDARTSLGLYYIHMNYHEEARKVVEPVSSLAQEMKYRKRLAQIYTITGSYRFIVKEDYDTAIRLLEEALSLSKELGDFICLFLAHFWLGYALVWQCNFHKALKHWQQALDINKAAGSLWGVSVLKSTMVWAYSKWGHIDRCYRISKEALGLAERSRDIFSTAYAFGGHGISLFHKGFLDDAEGNLLEAANLCEKINYYSMGSLFHGYLGETRYHLGDYQASIIAFEKAVEFSQQTKFVPSLTKLYKLSILRSKLLQKERIKIKEVYRCSAGNRVRLNDGLMAYHVAEILLNMQKDPPDVVETWITQAIEHDQKNKMNWYLGKDHLLAAAYWRQKQDDIRAWHHMKASMHLFEACGADGWAESIRKKMAGACLD
jgi:class 3 adenylate cyclase/tetratricopeptide (TPR) repeat protein